MYFFHSNLDFRILPFTISIYTKIARTRQSKNGEDTHHTGVRFFTERLYSRQQCGRCHQGADTSLFAAWPGKYFS